MRGRQIKSNLKYCSSSIRSGKAQKLDALLCWKSCGEGCRRGSDPALLWLWHRLAATALIQPLAWEPPYAAGAAQEIAKKRLD